MEGMESDPEVEAIAVEQAKKYEISQGRKPVSVEEENCGWDVTSLLGGQAARYIEVKGRAVSRRRRPDAERVDQGAAIRQGLLAVRRGQLQDEPGALPDPRPGLKAVAERRDKRRAVCSGPTRLVASRQERMKEANMSGKRIRLPFEDVRLTQDEVAIIQTRTFQRLFDLKQLGLAYLVYPNATHTRGTHSIRCLGEAVKILNGLRANRESIDDEDEKKVRLTALLHDIGHIPFSHTLEDEHVILSKHDRSARLDRVLQELKTELADQSLATSIDAAKPTLVAISNPEGPNADWRSDLVGNTISHDLLAYITADAEATGIEKRSGHYRVYEYFQRHGNRLSIRLTKGGIRTDVVSAIIDLLDMRFCLTERVFLHHAKCVASAMLARAARLTQLSDADEPQLIHLGDEGFFNYLEDKVKKIESASHEQGEGIKRLLYCLRARRLYQRIFKVGRQAQ